MLEFFYLSFPIKYLFSRKIQTEQNMFPQRTENRQRLISDCVNIPLLIAFCSKRICELLTTYLLTTYVRTYLLTSFRLFLPNGRQNEYTTKKTVSY